MSSPASFPLFGDGFSFARDARLRQYGRAVPGAIIHRLPGKRVQCCRIGATGRGRCTVPAPRTITSSGGNTSTSQARDKVLIYVSADRFYVGCRFNTFLGGGPAAYQHRLREWGRLPWVLTVDNGSECRILLAPGYLSRNVDDSSCRHQQARAVALVPRPNTVFSS